MKINEIITEAPVGLGKRASTFVKAKLGSQTAKGAQVANTNANNLFKAFQRQLGAGGKSYTDVTPEMLKTFFSQYGVASKIVDDAMQAVGIQGEPQQSDIEQPDTQANSQSDQPDYSQYDSPAYERNPRGSRSPTQQTELPLESVVNENINKKSLEQLFLKVVQMDPNLQKSDNEKIPGKVIDAIKSLSPQQQAALAKALTK